MKMKQQRLHNKVKMMKMTARITTTVIMTTTTTMTAVAALAMMSMKATMMITAKKCK